MLKQSLLYLSTAGWARGIATNFPVAKKVARRFVAGEQLTEAIEATKALNQDRISVTLDYLGESVARAEDTEEVVGMYLDVLDKIHAESLDASISLKLTHIGFDISEELAFLNLRTILERAKTHSIPVTIDMESTDYTDDTLRLYRTMRDEYDFDHVGTVIQAYLYRSEADMKELSAEGSHIRLCKGAYLEPPSVAYPDKEAVDKNYLHLIDVYLSESDDSYLCIATHDEAMIEGAETYIQREDIATDRYEFQMLYGIRSQRQQELAQAGHTMRVYVPFGEAWYPYFMRRLAERPANLAFFIRGFFS